MGALLYAISFNIEISYQILAIIVILYAKVAMDLKKVIALHVKHLMF
jgi:hypothetical protein